MHFVENFEIIQIFFDDQNDFAKMTISTEV